MHREIRSQRFALTVAALAGVTAACGGSPNAVRPSAAAAALPPAGGASARPAAAVVASAAGGVLTPEDLTSRGWTCFQPPVVPLRTICSHPNQGLPVVGNPPPADRPATYNLFRFDETGAFVGSVHLIRTDLYHGQPCEPAGGPYVLVPIIGYYECVHPGGR